MECHASDDGVDRSFSVKLDDGRVLRRNSTFIHHRSIATGSAEESQSCGESGGADKAGEESTLHQTA